MLSTCIILIKSCKYYIVCLFLKIPFQYWYLKQCQLKLENHLCYDNHAMIRIRPASPFFFKEKPQTPNQKSCDLFYFCPLLLRRITTLTDKLFPVTCNEGEVNHSATHFDVNINSSNCDSSHSQCPPYQVTSDIGLPTMKNCTLLKIIFVFLEMCKMHSIVQNLDYIDNA